MPIIECRNGYAETYVGGTQYQFNRDKHGRYVAGIENPAHLHCFLAREEMYRVVPEAPEPDATGDSDGGTSDGEAGTNAPPVAKAKRGGTKKAEGTPPDPNSPADATGE